MAEFRTCPLSGRVVIIAPERGARPIAAPHFEPHHRDRDPGGFCPFCPGNEWDTPPAIVEHPVRVVPNKYSANPGYHDVVIDTREHVSDPTQYDLTDVLWTYRERVMNLMADPQVKSVSVFKNVGAEAGASLPHAHSQILATPFVPEELQRELDGAAKNPSVFEQLLKTNIVMENDEFGVVCPAASRFAYEMWVIPKARQPQFEMISRTQCEILSSTLRRILLSLDRVQNRPAYNWVLHSYPSPSFRWHLEILPRTARPAGFEWATGVFINTVPPEDACHRFFPDRRILIPA